MATIIAPGMTVEEYMRLDTDGLTELVDGEVIEMPTPGFLHGIVCANIIGVLLLWSRPQNLGIVASNDSSLVIRRNPDTVRGPDVMFIATDRIPEGGFPEGPLGFAPDLAVEVFSPSNRWADLHRKVGEYLALGTREVWIADPGRRTLHRFRPDAPPAMLDQHAELTSDVLPGFRCGVGELFADV